MARGRARTVATTSYAASTAAIGPAPRSPALVGTPRALLTLSQPAPTESARPHQENP